MKISRLFCLPNKFTILLFKIKVNAVPGRYRKFYVML